ncbi:uncharacterized protein RAG0_09175 [Rhynchosporium agropyri]|uniref:Uncharacterized protein n=1 Tax=Rhynchosporium agropyri TaxID=914238 RepID=A0A1E1KU61_9HELO|nr:uncharacterized protein RAG0_09175 [Rhynchosporium agropyri]
MRFTSLVFLGLSAFTVTQAGSLGDRGECKGGGDCVSGVCRPWVGTPKSHTGSRCVGSGNKGELCKIGFAGSCKAPYECINEIGGNDTGTCSDS